MPTFLRKAVIFIAFLASVSINAVEAVKQSELRGKNLSREEATDKDATSSDFLTPPMEEGAMDTGVVDRALNGRAKEMNIIKDEHEPLFQVPSKEVMDEFKKSHQMKLGIDLPMIKISKRNTIKVNGAVHSMDDLLPMDVFSPDATYVYDGKKKPLPAVATFMKVDSDTTMLVTKGPGGNVQTIDITFADGSNTYMEEVSGGVLAVMLPEARDKEAISKSLMADTKLIGESGNNSSEPQIGSSSGNAKEIGLGWRKLMEQSDSSREERHLQSGCSMLRVIEVAIAYDSSFCSKMNGASNANAVIQQIVARVSTQYQNDFCGKVQISYIEGFCDPSTDPYAAGVRLNQSGCGISGLLQFFSNFWSTNRGSVRRDAAHLFAGTSFECDNTGSCVIGCANVQSLCDTRSSYGVNHITFFTDRQLQSDLLAHELGHNCGATHGNPNNNQVISNYLAGSSCISVEPSQPLIPNWSTCTRGSSTCANNWVCCVAPADVSSGKATCRPNLSAAYCASSSTVPNWSTCRRNVDTCGDGYTCCVAPADVSSGKTTCRPTSGGWCAS